MSIKPYILLINCSPEDAEIYIKHHFDNISDFIIYDDIEKAPQSYFCNASGLGKAITDIMSSVLNTNNNNFIHLVATQDRRKYEHTYYKFTEKNIGVLRLKVQRFGNDDWRQILVSKTSANFFNSNLNKKYM